jgi:DNA replication protein DnaC
MNPKPELTPLLKSLKLPGIIDALEARNRQAIEAKLSYTEFLALLLQDEIARREQNSYTRRLREAGFRLDKTLENFDLSKRPGLNPSLIAELATCRFITEYSPVLICGHTGTGKSHVAQALAHCAVRAGHRVLFTTQSKLLDSLQAARAAQRFAQRLQALARLDLIAIDDFGLRPLRSPHDEDFHELIAERYERAASSILTSNLDFSEWGAAFENHLLAAATLDRLRHNAYRIVLEGESSRTPRPLPEPRKAGPGKAAGGSRQSFRNVT